MEADKVKIAWPVEWDNVQGNAYGYFVHDKMLRQHVNKIAHITPDAPDAVLIMSAEFFTKKMPDKRTWVFSMFEGSELPENYVANLSKADFLLVPSKWVKELFDRYFDPLKVFVVNHGVDHSYSYKRRTSPGNSRPFRYLWVGAPNPRKGYEEISVVWREIFKHRPYCELYMKTTLVNGVHVNGNVILDGRNLSQEEMIKLYHSAHCFVFPTRGEGFGLTLAEAMATGLPCISTDYSGVTDFFDNGVGFPIPFAFGKGIWKDRSGKEYEAVVAYPSPEKLAEKMLYVQTNYHKALDKGKAASVRIKTRFTWKKSAETLVNLIKEQQC